MGSTCLSVAMEMKLDMKKPLADRKIQDFKVDVLCVPLLYVMALPVDDHVYFVSTLVWSHYYLDDDYT